MRRSIIAYLLALWPTLALADGFPIVPLPLPLSLVPYVVSSSPRHIYRDGQYFFCPYPGYDLYCQLPSDPSWALYGPPWRQRPPVVSVPVLNSLLRDAPPHVPFALHGRLLGPPPAPPPVIHAPQQPQGSVDESRERVIQMGEEHCRRYPRDSICHPPKQ